MKFQVFQFWTGTPATIREVTLPDDVVENNRYFGVYGMDGVRLGLLNSIFHYGQNEVQQLQTPSVSVGDIIELKFEGEIEFWVVAMAGFENYGRDKQFLFHKEIRKQQNEQH